MMPTAGTNHLRRLGILYDFTTFFRVPALHPARSTHTAMSLLAGEQALAWEIMAACRDVCHDITLKIILETGRLRTPQNIAAVIQGAIEIGADFIKTSTGKVEVSATLSAATVMLSTIKQSGKPVGFKAAGGIRTTAAAIEYLDLAKGIMGSGWATPDTFRIGASALLEDLLTVLDRNEQS